MVATQPTTHRSALLRILITTALVIISLLLMAILGIAYYQIQHISDHFSDMLDNESQRSQIAFRLSQNALNCRRFEKDLLLAMGDPAEVATYSKLWHESYTELTKNIDALTALAADDDEIAEMQALSSKAQHYLQGGESLIAQINAGQVDDPLAGNQLLEPYKEDIRLLIEVTTELAQRETQEANEIGSNIRSDLQEMLTLLLVLTGVSVALVVGLGLLLPSRLMRPLRELQEATEQFTAGNYQARAPVLRGDELGQLAQSFNTMADTISQQIRDLDQRDLVEQQNTQMKQLGDLVRQLETPVIVLAPQVLLVPVVGYVDSRRAEMISKTVLSAIHKHRIAHILLDITGLVEVDGQVVRMIQRLVGASTLLGAQVIITGVSASVAQLVVANDIQLPEVHSFAQLQDGLSALMHERTVLTAAG